MATSTETVSPKRENTDVSTAGIPHRLELQGSMLVAAILSLWLSPMFASLLLACVPIAAYFICVLTTVNETDVIEGESREELKVALLQARDEIARAEANKKRAVEGSTVDRDRVYRLRGELAALGGSEDRVHFLLGIGDASTASERAKLRRAAVAACRECEEHRLVADEMVSAVENLRQRARDLETEIEETLQRRETEQTSREHLDEEKTKLIAQASRFQAKITAQDEQLRHARKELQSYTGYSQTEKRRLESDLASGLQVKMRQVRTEEQVRRQRQGERRFVESVGDRLYETLEERSQQVQILHVRLKQEASEKQTIAHAIEIAKQEVLKYESREERIDEATPKGSVDICDFDASLQNGNLPKAKAKSSKSSKGKKKKDDDLSGNKDLEDLELERAAAVAAKELAEKNSKDMAASAEAKMALAKKHADTIAKDCKEIEARLALIKKEGEQIATNQCKISESLKENNDKANELDKQVKDVERGKIRLRLDLKKLRDAKQEARAAPAESEVKESRSLSVESHPEENSEKTDVQPEPRPTMPTLETSPQDSIAEHVPLEMDLKTEVSSSERTDVQPEPHPTMPTLEAPPQDSIAEHVPLDMDVKTEVPSSIETLDATVQDAPLAPIERSPEEALVTTTETLEAVAQA